MVIFYSNDSEEKKKKISVFASTDDDKLEVDERGRGKKFIKFLKIFINL